MFFSTAETEHHEAEQNRQNNFGLCRVFRNSKNIGVTLNFDDFDT